MILICVDPHITIACIVCLAICIYILRKCNYDYVFIWKEKKLNSLKFYHV